MAWRKSPPELIETFHAALPPDPKAERRQMCGYPASFVNGNMWTGLHQENMILRLGEPARSELLAVPGAAVFEPMKGRPMKEYVVVPPKLLDDGKSLRKWVTRAFEYAQSLPPKKKPAKKK